jgi:hypothetical protein
MVGIDKKFNLRWVLEYRLKKPIYGPWDDSSPHLSDTAWSKDKTGLKYAVIEGEDKYSFTPIRFLECEADRFVCFKWVSAVSMPANMPYIKSSGVIVGLQLITPAFSYTVYIDGTITKKDLTDHDKKFDLKEFQTRIL